ncbi:hypothetical protein LOTGIDRAFT_185419 [Lottia gigantea]|uniref:Protein sleepless n=1 Tax=Lottia gigantea TaxID=225164 RepID=V4AIS5_LOTGI|nr:hypothetical protein LOTGIDRAFT_185419 [Lottia gigantea]ESP04019.1 hypothetical protein LOTGIDRAFT_185419 [Lottia gigantea]
MNPEMMQICRKAFLTCLSLLLLADTVYGIACYQCNSTLESNCQDQFDHSDLNPQKSTLCQMYNARYCVKVTGLWGGIVGTHRFCSSRDMGDQCQDIGYADHDRMYRACIFTCTSDDCNSSTMMTLSKSLAYLCLYSSYFGNLSKLTVPLDHSTSFFWQASN